ncbi:MAG: hypothetical protein H6903_13490 [Rhodobacteraceae bacterium]|nr:hypothetical protein [Paracoccaceae bacterium]
MKVKTLPLLKLLVPLLTPVMAAIVFSLLWRSNRNRLRFVLKPTWSHIVTTAILALATPIGADRSLPLPAIVLLIQFEPDYSMRAVGVWIVVFFIVWYLPASLAVVAIRNRVLRFVNLCLFWGGYAGFLYLALRLSDSEGYLMPGI